MIAKCPFCGGSMNFDSDIQKMVCNHCTRMCNVDEVSEEIKINNVTKQGLDTFSAYMPDEEFNPSKDDVSEELMDCEIYECKSCGAKLSLNNVETSTFCAYCGQPTIVFDRIAKRRRPKYIIPFVFSKEDAIERIKNCFSDSKYVSQDLDHIEKNIIRGIYIPFALFDIYYKDKQLLKSTKENTYYFRSGTGDYRQIPVDASSQLPNNLSELLEPYKIDNLTLFKSKYLSGYYADLRDEDFDDLKQIALSRVEKLFNYQTLRTIPDKNCKLVRHDPKYETVKENYVLFPAWFMIYHKNNKTYTLLVNGQTGKVVGTFPYDKSKLKSKFFKIFGLISIFCIMLLLTISRFSILTYIVSAVLFTTSFILFSKAKSNFKSYNNKINLMTEDKIMNYVLER